MSALGRSRHRGDIAKSVARDPRRTSDKVMRYLEICGAFLSSLPRHAFGRSVGRQREPRVAQFLPHPDSWRREIRVGKVSDGNSDVLGETLALPVDG